MATLERVKAQEAAAITGLSLRSIQSLALRAQIPGAAKLGRDWTFDLGKLRAWVASQEQAVIDRAAWNRPPPPPTFHLAQPGSDNLLAEAIARKLGARR